ncbi:uncharacterized protein LOC111345759 [Stylophora pistillata]|uniref:uncharacterized protein LOC111345759 n=1 Tax=Stylophora pistillata TaxID=50429 RepID=UPI000C03A2F1|nr:uncharacterized protein LOC111345759 [Stylophora pistillata]
MADSSGVSQSKRLENFPKVSSITISSHLKGCGKGEVGDKGYKFFSENYIHNVYTSDEATGHHIATGLCHRTQRKNEPAHAVKITLQTKNGMAEVSNSLCSCKAGSGGHCNH